MSSTPHKKNVVENSAFQAEGSIHIGDITYNFNDKEVKIPHLLTNNIPSNADHILGRDTELQTISTHLAQNKPTVLVNGIGGIGKTSVAAKYVATFGNQYTHLAWLTVQSSVAEAFTNDLVLLKSLHIEQDVRQLIETQRLTDAFKLVVKKLNDLNKTLVVLDNANNPDDLITHKNLFDTAKCHYLITSRTQPQEWTIVEIDHLPPDEAIKLFQNLAPSVLASKEDLKGLLSKLFYHTLLIELVAKAANKSKISFITLENIVNEKFIHDTKLNKHAIKTGVSGSFENSFKRANVQKYIWFIFQSITSIPDKSKELLRAFALLPIATSFEEDFLEKHFQLLDLEECVIDILDDLVESGWLNEAVDKEKTAYKMHPLITDVVVKHLDINANYADKYINHVAELILFDNAEPSHILHEKKKNEPLAERLVDLFFNENTEGVSMLLHWLSWLKKQLGFFKSALKLSKRALQIAQNLTHIDEVSLFERQAVLGQIYKSLGNYPKATDLLSDGLLLKLLGVFDKIFGIVLKTVVYLLNLDI